MAVSARPTAPGAAGQAADDDPIARWVELGPGRPTPDRVLISGNAVSVTAVITQLRLEGGNRAAVEAADRLPSEAVDAALAYYARHRAVIDAAITLNAAAFSG